MAVVVVLVVILLVLHELAVDLMKKSIAVDRVKSTRIISCHRFFFCIVIHALDCFPILLLGSYSEGCFFVSEKISNRSKIWDLNLDLKTWEERFTNLILTSQSVDTRHRSHGNCSLPNFFSSNAASRRQRRKDNEHLPYRYCLTERGLGR